MAISNKYEQLSEEAPEHFRAQHARLGRAVEIHRVECNSDPQAAKRARDIASKMSRLDHPLIPYLIDFLEDETSCQLVVEEIEPSDSANGPLQLETDVLDQLSLFEQIADALCHAAERGIAHGTFDLSCVHQTGKGVAKLSGLGLKQLRAGASEPTFDQLKKDDLSKLKQLVSNSVQAFSERASEEANELNAVKQLQHRAAEREDDVCRFSGDLRTWLHRELAIREAKKLAFADRETKSSDSPTEQKSLLPLVAGAAIGFLMLSGLLLAYFLWPTPPTEKLASNGEQVTDNSEQQNESPSPVTSNLQDVGTLNNESPSDDEATTSNQESSPDEPNNSQPNAADSTPEPSTEPEAVPTEMPDVSKPEPEVEPEPEPTAEPGSPAGRTISPFENVATTTELPPVSSTEVVELFETDLQEDEPLGVKLLTNPPDAKRPEFSLEENSAKQLWNIVLRHKTESTIVAMIARRDAKLSFKWTPAAADSPLANELRNSLIESTHKNWAHHLALRQAIIRPAAAFDLERNRPYNLDIAHVPRDMFLEFVPSDDSLAVASPQQISWNGDAMMTIGLDAGKESLVILQIKPQRRAKLRTAGLARQSPESRRLPIKKGFGRNLSLSMRTLNKTLFTMKEGVKTIKGKNAAEQKKIVQTRIELLEEQKKISEVFAEAYMAAVATKLHLRVYFEVQGQKIVLVDYAGDIEPIQASR